MYVLSRIDAARATGTYYGHGINNSLKEKKRASAQSRAEALNTLNRNCSLNSVEYYEQRINNTGNPEDQGQNEADPELAVDFAFFKVYGQRGQ